MTKAPFWKYGGKTLSVGLVTLLVLVTFAGVAYNTAATDLDQGWAIIITPGMKWSHHKEARDLHAYLIDRGWDDDHIIFLSSITGWSFCDGAPTIENFEDAIEFVNESSTLDDVVFIAVLDHGVKTESGDYYLRFGKRLDEFMSGPEFGEELDGMVNYNTMVVDIAGSYSGAFIDEVRADDRIIVTDCDCNESYRKSEYTFHEALTDEDADSDGDGQVSVEEAHAFMVESMYNTTPQIYDPDEDEDFVIPEF